jgi:hypothetical protein
MKSGRKVPKRRTHRLLTEEITEKTAKQWMTTTCRCHQALMVSRLHQFA